MASLRSMILDNPVLSWMGDPGNPLNLSSERLETEVLIHRYTVRLLRERDTILVNAQKVFDDVRRAFDDTPEIVAAEIAEPQRVPRPKPPYLHMWIEALQRYRSGQQVRAGILVVRQPGNVLDGVDWNPVIDPAKSQVIRDQLAQDRPADFVTGYLWYEVPGTGETCCEGRIIYWLDKEGNLQFSFRNLNQVPREEEQERTLASMRAQQNWLLHTMARLNCHNVELKAIPGQGKANPRKPRPPASVWHEIVVKPSLLVRRARAENPIDAEKHAVRLHKVRGHYADYRSGLGLFGKYKVLIWVDEHEAGEAELGTVVGSYRVE